MDGFPSVSEVYMRRDTAVSRAFVQRRKKPGGPEPPFLNLWPTSSAMYGADEGSKDVEAASASFAHSSAP